VPFVAGPEWKRPPKCRQLGRPNVFFCSEKTIAPVSHVLAKNGEFDERIAREYLHRLLSLCGKKRLDSSSIANEFDRWLDEKKRSASTGTYDSHAHTVKNFLKFLGPKATHGLAEDGRKRRKSAKVRGRFCSRETSKDEALAPKKGRRGLTEVVHSGRLELDSSSPISFYWSSVYAKFSFRFRLFLRRSFTIAGPTYHGRISENKCQFMLTTFCWQHWQRHREVPRSQLPAPGAAAPFDSLILLRAARRCKASALVST
jgi:hypothetical protein